MATTRYVSESSDTALSQVEFFNNSFGRLDAVLYANELSAGALKELPEKLKKRGITTYPDIRDGQQVLVAYGFKKPENLLNTLKKEGVITSLAKPTTHMSEDEQKTEKSFARKFIQRYAIRLAAASGLLGHASMAAVSALTKDNKWFGTAWKYTLADATIATYGTDKSVNADPIMQDFKDYLWKQGVDNSFVKARTDKISMREGFDTFMKKNSFQIANAFGAMGNINQVQIGLDDKNTGFVVAGVTSLFGAGLQIFGSEKKRNPEQMKRKGLFSRLFAFLDANPMQVAAATNFTDPFALFYAAYNNKKIEAKNMASNNAELEKAYAQFGNANIQTSNLFHKEGTAEALVNSKNNFAAAGQVAQELEAEYAKKNNFFKRFTDPFNQEKADRLEAEFNDKYKTLLGENGLNGQGGLVENFPEKFKKDEILSAAKNINRIESLQADNAKIARGGKWKTALLYLVATFYTGATVLRLIARKTAGAEENKDAFNEVYAAAAESLMNIKEPQKREEMLTQMGHYLSTHEKMKESSEIIINKLRERVEVFDKSPFIDVPEHLLQVAETPVVETAELTTPAQEPAPIVAEAVTDHSKAEEKPAASWTQKTETEDHKSHEAMVEANRQKASEQTVQPLSG